MSDKNSKTERNRRRLVNMVNQEPEDSGLLIKFVAADGSKTYCIKVGGEAGYEEYEETIDPPKDRLNK